MNLLALVLADLRRMYSGCQLDLKGIFCGSDKRAEIIMGSDDFFWMVFSSMHRFAVSEYEKMQRAKE